MDVREKLFTLFQDCNNPSWKWFPNNAEMLKLIDYLIAHGVTVQEWISVKDELPKYTDEYNVMVGVASEFGYFEKVTTLRFERIKGKEPRWVIPKNEIYNVISWMPMPQPPKGE